MIRYRTATMIVKFHHYYEKIKNNKGNGKVEYPKAHLKKGREEVKKITLGMTALMLVLSLSACGELKEAQNAFKKGNEEKETAAEGKKSALNNLLGAIQGDKESYEDDTPVSDLEAYNNYVDLSNFMTGDVESALDRYFAGVEASSDFHPVENGYYIANGFSSTNYDFLDTVESQADLGTAYPDVDNAAMELIPALRNLMQVLDEAADYGKQKSYLDDNYAKGEEIHSRFVPAVNSYDDLRVPFLNSLRDILKEQQKKDLERLEKEGYTIRYQMLKLTVLKSEIMNVIYAQENVSDENILSLDVTDIKPKYEEYSSILAEFATNYKDKAEQEKEGFETYQSTQLGLFYDAVVNFKVQTQALISRVEEQREYSEAEKLILRTADGSLEHLAECGSDVTSRYNSVID